MSRRSGRGPLPVTIPPAVYPPPPRRSRPDRDCALPTCTPTGPRRTATGWAPPPPGPASLRWWSGGHPRRGPGRRAGAVRRRRAPSRRGHRHRDDRTPRALRPWRDRRCGVRAVRHRRPQRGVALPQLPERLVPAVPEPEPEDPVERLRVPRHGVGQRSPTGLAGG